MKNKLLVLSLIILLGLNPVLAIDNGTPPVPLIAVKNSDISLNKNITKKEVKLNKTEVKITGYLDTNSDEALKQAISLQKESDIDDLESLWNSTVNRNSVIKFALKKIATPPEHRKMQSSLMARSVSSLISGVSILPTIFGSNAGIRTASAASGQIANNAIKKNMKPKDIPLTDTELIQLAGLVEDLQNDLIKAYYNYKNSINSLILCRQKLMLHHKNYSQAIAEQKNTAIIINSAMYDNQILEEIALKQKVKLHKLELERLAGKAIVENLNLSRIAYNQQYSTQSISTTKTDNN